MCQRVKCQTCGKWTWTGCGNHVASVMKDIPTNQRCSCQRK